MILWGVSVPDLVVVLVPVFAAAAFVIRYFWTVNKCLALIKSDYRRLKDEAERGSHTHGDLYSLLREINERLSRVEGRLNGS